MLDDLRSLAAALKPIDLAVIAAYFAVVMGIGFWASRRVKNEQDYFLGGRGFGKWLLTMHWLCTGTHSEQAVQVAAASARVGLGGVWYQWYMMFSTPFYWLIAPITRRMRVITTGDFFRIRYSRGLEVLYTAMALAYFALSIAMLLLGAGKAISGATGGAVETNATVILLAVLFSSYIVAGGLMAAAYTDVLQGLMIVALSILLVPFGLSLIGGFEGLHARLPAEMFAVTAREDAAEGNHWWVLAMSALGLVGIVAQPHVMSATASGKTEMEARVGMVYGNFIKRFLTVAWAFVGLIALAHFYEGGLGIDKLSREDSEVLFGRAIREFLGDGWRGLMIACIVAGITASETMMVVGSALFTRNLYRPAVLGQTDRHYLWVGRLSAAGMLLASIVLALTAPSVTSLLLTSVKLIGLLGAAVWLGVSWRRANTAGVWASVAGAGLVWALASVQPTAAPSDGPLGKLIDAALHLALQIGLHRLSEPQQIAAILAAEFGLLIAVSLATRPHGARQLDPVFARLYTPVGREAEVAPDRPDPQPHESATLGMEGVSLDYSRACRFGYAALRKCGLEIPRLTPVDWIGFAAAWLVVGAILAAFAWLAQFGA
jgi:Na+/proline symporter